MGSDILFNSAQLSAISHGRGPALVIAGPGSGKTAVITARIHHLTEKLHIPKDNILVLTFTRMAAEEMRRRYASSLKKNHGHQNESFAGSSVTFGTFHGIFWRILTRETSLDGRSILSDWEQKIFIKRCLIKIGDMGYKRLSAQEIRNLGDDEINEYISIVSAMANEESGDGKSTIMKTPGSIGTEVCYNTIGTEFRVSATGDVSRGVTGIPEKKLLYRLYCEEKRKNHRVDYDDMASECLKLFREQPQVLRKWQDRYRYILVDEFQDINRSQYLVLKALGKHGNVFAVGDDDQSIYGFRGASPGFMKLFLNDFAGSERLFLNINYRSGSSIITAAGSLISNNRDRMPKNILPGTFREGRVELVRVLGKASEREMILEKIRQYHNDGMPYENMALLTRKNYDLAGFSNMLALSGIPINNGKEKTSWKAQEEVKDLASYIAVGLGPVKRGDFIRIMNKPMRRLSKLGLDREILSWEEIISNYSAPEYDDSVREEIRKLYSHVMRIQSLSPEMIFPYLIKVVGYNCSDRELMERLREEASAYNTPFDFLEYLRDTSSTEKGGGITLTTYHGSKGLEFSLVFLPMLLEGIVPEPRAIIDNDPEEERRMLYVAMTRAKDHLVLSYPETVSGKFKKPSPFLRELKPVTDQPQPSAYTKPQAD